MDDQKNNEKQNNRKLHFLYLAIIFLLGGLCVYLATQYSGLKTIVAEREITITQVIQEREDVKTWFDLVDLDDHVTFGGKA